MHLHREDHCSTTISSSLQCGVYPVEETSVGESVEMLTFFRNDVDGEVLRGFTG